MTIFNIDICLIIRKGKICDSIETEKDKSGLVHTVRLSCPIIMDRYFACHSCDNK